MSTKWFTDLIPKTYVCLKEGYSWGIFRSDLLAGVTVGIVALPLAMAFAIASGVAPAAGLFTAIIAGFLISLLGGSRVQIGGPTGAFVVIVYGIVARHGYEGLALATLIAGALLVCMGLFRMGALMRFIPYPLIMGFTTAIALLIFSSQVKDFFGLKIPNLPADFLPKWKVLIQMLPSFDVPTLMVAAGTLALILIVRRFFPRLPWGIFAIVLPTLICYGFNVSVETIESRFGELPSMLSVPSLPAFHFSLDTLQAILPDAITIALLAGIESLLSAVVADGMIGGAHKSNAELLAQGVANIGSIFFGGIPATGAIARTAANVKCGAKTPIAGMVHALTLLLILIALSPMVSKVPLAALAAVLMMIAWNMSELSNFFRLLKAPSGDVAVLLSAFFLTVFIDLTVAVEVGMILAALLFMKRMSDLGKIAPLQEEEGFDPDAIGKRVVPKGVEVYEINGPFFFGVVGHFKDLLKNMEKVPKVFILRLRHVPVIDASGMHALIDFYHKCQRSHTALLLSGVQGEVADSLEKYGLYSLVGGENIFSHIDPALQRANHLVEFS